MSPDPDADLERLRAICMALPHAAEKRSHGAPVFFIEKGRTFAWFLHDHHGCGITAVALKVSGLEEHELLVEAQPELYYRPAYFTAAAWIGMRLDVAETDWEHVAEKVAASWALAAPTRLRQAFGG